MDGLKTSPPRHLVASSLVHNKRLTATTKPPRTMYANEGLVTCGVILGEFVSVLCHEMLYGLPSIQRSTPSSVSIQVPLE